MHWHIPTLLQFGALVLAVAWVGMSLLWLRDRSTHLRDWCVGVLVGLVGLLLLSQQARLPPWAGVVLANVLVVTGTALLVLGLARVVGRPPPWRWLAGTLAALVLAYLGFTYLWPQPAGRAISFNLALAAVTARALLDLHGAERRLGWAVTLVPALLFAALTGLALARLISSLQQWQADAQTLWQLQGSLIALVLLAAVALLQALLAMHAASLLRRVEQLAETDTLTGLLNRGGFEPRLALEWQRAQRQGSPLSMLMLDVDHFKQINDRHGHAMGDRVLRHLGQLLKAQVRPYDVVARLGGEEFVVLLPGLPLAAAQQAGERLRAACLAAAPDAQEPVPRFTLSIGVAEAQADESADTALARADAALYRAKHGGRDRVEV